jgi:hypothetical protein
MRRPLSAPLTFAIHSQIIVHGEFRTVESPNEFYTTKQKLNQLEQVSIHLKREWFWWVNVHVPRNTTHIIRPDIR